MTCLIITRCYTHYHFPKKKTHYYHIIFFFNTSMNSERVSIPKIPRNEKLIVQIYFKVNLEYISGYFSVRSSAPITWGGVLFVSTTLDPSSHRKLEIGPFKTWIALLPRAPQKQTPPPIQTVRSGFGLGNPGPRPPPPPRHWSSAIPTRTLK